ncbi:MAG: DUF4926 domain-containing protein [Nitrospirae bacterium]|nr:MAG: DUF4926 domain-containing protein [Nitrospirota bacterium]
MRRPANGPRSNCRLPEQLHSCRNSTHERSDSVIRCGALTEDIPDRGLLRGQVGTVVEVLGAGVFEVEFVDNDGRTYAMLPLRTNQLLVLHY